MITLYTFGPAFGLSDSSPFVTKTALLLKLAGITFTENRKGFSRAPKGKLPFIEDDGAVVADSTFIRWHIEKKYGFDFDAQLSASERGVAWAVEKLLEDHLYWTLVHARWCNDANFAKGPSIYFRSIPLPFRPVVERLVRKKVRRNLYGQGIGRHTQEQIVALAAKDLEAVSAILGDKPYLMGDHPCSADASLYAFVAGGPCPHFDTLIRGEAERYQNLVAYVARLKAQYFS